MKEIITGHGESDANIRIAGFIAQRCGTPNARWIDYTTIGLVDGGELVAGCLYSDFTGRNILTYFAGAPGRKWLNRDLLWYGFYYPFVGLGCDRVTGLVRSDNLESLRMVWHMGYRLEAVLRGTYGRGIDTLVMVMWKPECKWLKIMPDSMRKNHGREITFASAAA